MAKQLEVKPLPFNVAVDPGFGNGKLFSSAMGMNTIPSAVAQSEGQFRRKTGWVAGKELELDNLCVEIDGKFYHLGEKALDVQTNEDVRTTKEDRANDWKSQVLFRTLIALGTPHEASGNINEYEVYIKTGLPNKNYDDDNIYDPLEAFLSQPYDITFYLDHKTTIKKRINPVKVDIIRQPEGSMLVNQCHFNLEFNDEDGNPLFFRINPGAKKNVGIVDIGHFTTDYGIFIKGALSEARGTSGSTVATREVYEELKRTIPHLKEFQLDEAVRYRKIIHAGKEVDVSKEVDNAIDRVASNMAEQIINAWSNNIEQLLAIVITGGGAHIFTEALKKHFRLRTEQEVEVLQGVDPQQGNVVGYYMHACFVEWQEGSYSYEEIRQQWIDTAIKFLEEKNLVVKN